MLIVSFDGKTCELFSIFIDHSVEKYMKLNERIFVIYRKKICPNACQTIWEKKYVFPTSCDHRKKCLKVGFENLMEAMEFLASTEKSNGFPDTLKKIVANLSQIDSLQENIGPFEEHFRAVFEYIRNLKSSSAHEKKHLQIGFENLTKAIEFFASKKKSNGFPNTLQEMVANLSQIDSLQENIGPFEEHFRAMFKNIRKLKRSNRKSRRNDHRNNIQLQEAGKNQL